MKMDGMSFMSTCKEVIADLLFLLFSYEEIEKDATGKQEEIQELDGAFGEILGRMNDVINFAGQSYTIADVVSEELTKGLEITSLILKTKSRILEKTMPPAGTLHFEEKFSLN